MNSFGGNGAHLNFYNEDMSTATVHDKEVEWAGQTLRLCPERAVWWTPRDEPAGGTLWIADPHWGKADLFRRRGIPVPHDATEADLLRLSVLLERTGATRLIVLGDLLHSRLDAKDAVVESVAVWREQHSELDIRVVRGNHDRHAGPPLDAWRMSGCEEPYVLDHPPFILRHHPEDDPRGPVLCGHVHPSVTPRSEMHDATVRTPCFHWEAGRGERGCTHGRLVLPAFGGFTGTQRIRPAEGDRVFAVAESSVLELPPAMVRGKAAPRRPATPHRR